MVSVALLGAHNTALSWILQFHVHCTMHIRLVSVKLCPWVWYHVGKLLSDNIH